MYFSFYLFQGMTNAEVLHEVKHGYRIPCPSRCPPDLYRIMLQTWHKDPKERPTFQNLQWKLEHFFTLEGSEGLYKPERKRVDAISCSTTHRAVS